MSDELLNCPFLKHGVPRYKKSQYGHTVEVIDPNTRYEDQIYQIPYFPTKDEAITAWNTRANPITHGMLECMLDTALLADEHIKPEGKKHMNALLLQIEKSQELLK